MKGFQKAGKSMAAVGEGMTKYVTLPIVAAGAVSAKFAIDFQRDMEMVHTQAGASQMEVKKLSDQVLKLDQTGKVAQGPQVLAEGLYHLESVGLRGAKAMRALKVASDGAATGNADLEATTNALAGAIVTGIKGAGDYRHAMALLNATVGAGNMRMDDLASSLRSGVLPAARTAGLGLHDVVAALALLSDEAVPPTVAATRLRMSFSLLAAPSQAAAKQLHSIGLSGTQMAKAMRGPDGLIGALQLLKDHLQGLSAVKQEQVLSRAFGGGRSGGTIMSLINNLDRLKMKYDQIGKTAGHFNKDVVEAQQTDAFKLSAAWAQVQASLIKVGGVTAPVLTQLAQYIARAADAFTSLSQGTQTTVIKMLAFAAAVGPILFVFGKLIGLAASVGEALLAVRAAIVTTTAAEAAMEVSSVGLVAALGPIGIGLAAIGVAGAGLYALFSSNGKSADELAGAYRRASSAVDSLKRSLDNVKSSHDAAIAANHQHTAAAHNLTAAVKNYNHVAKTEGKNSLDAKQALDQVHSAQDTLRQSTAALALAVQKEKDERAKAIATKKRDRAAVDSLVAATRKAIQEHNRDAGSVHAGVGAYLAHQKAVQQNAGALQNLAGKLDTLAGKYDAAAKKLQTTNPGLSQTQRNAAAAARATAELIRQLGALPSHKQVKIQIETDRYTTYHLARATPTQHRAAGGPVAAGVPYTVGEHGEETFVPNTDGTIVPHGAKRGGALVHIEHLTLLNGNRADARALARFLEPELRRVVKV